MTDLAARSGTTVMETAVKWNLKYDLFVVLKIREISSELQLFFCRYVSLRYILFVTLIFVKCVTGNLTTNVFHLRVDHFARKQIAFQIRDHTHRSSQSSMMIDYTSFVSIVSSLHRSVRFQLDPEKQLNPIPEKQLNFPESFSEKRIIFNCLVDD